MNKNIKIIIGTIIVVIAAVVLFIAGRKAVTAPDNKSNKPSLNELNLPDKNIITDKNLLNLNQSSVFPTGSATLSWHLSGENNLAGYMVYYGTAPRTGDCPPGGYPNKTDAGKTGTYTFKNLPVGSTYYFSITAYNSSKKESCFSGEVKKEIKPVQTPK